MADIDIIVTCAELSISEKNILKFRHSSWCSVFVMWHQLSPLTHASVFYTRGVLPIMAYSGDRGSAPKGYLFQASGV